MAWDTSLSKTSAATADLLHALDLVALDEWNSARDLLERIDDPLADRLLMLSNDLQKRERERERLLATTRHEIANALAIALANIEGVIDGVVDPTPARRRGIREALVAAGERLEGLNSLPPESVPAAAAMRAVNLESVSSNQIAFVSALAKAKRVTVVLAGSSVEQHGDPVQIGAFVRDALVTAIRRTPPGGSVTVRLARGRIEIASTDVDGSQAMKVIELRFDTRAPSAPRLG